MALAIFIYAILDGYDLGVGILLPMQAHNKPRRDTMIASIGPFWDANETWLVLAVGLLLIAFPTAHNAIFHDLYLATAILLAGLIARGVAFDFRTKAADQYHHAWDVVFRAGSLTAALAQGYMLGMYVTGFEHTVQGYLFSALSAVCVAAAYSYIGACWLVMKTEGELQAYAAKQGRRAGWLCALGVSAVCIVNPLVNPHVAEIWFSLPTALGLFIIPVICIAMFVLIDRLLKYIPTSNDQLCWLPFAACILIFFCCFQGLVISFYPYLVPGKIDIWQAASATASLKFMLVGVVIVVPVILLYTAFLYRVFWGKATQLKYY
ncbi:MAG: cytochrome d ubiquinol oxidase subunit II [Pseudomonadales bacterium]|nr:cytochrome d ubiquinol oxidase subunit II [Pseudomonadales bacterium]